MNPAGNTILITGGGSGIGRGLAEAFHALGNRVIIAGRRQGVLDQATSANPGMQSIVLDIEQPGSTRSFAADVTQKFPQLNVLINNAGIMRAEKLLSQPDGLADAEAIIATNLLGPIRLTAALLQHFRQQPHATIVNVSSGLAFVPLALTPTYCATKAAIHSYTQSLRWQLRSTAIEVLEIVPPYVQTDLMDGAEDPRAMPLNDFIAETMSLITRQPTPPEICVERVSGLRNAEKEGRYAATFNGLNSAMAGDH
ncbi:MAG TPA: SDR family oxidoreductase [Terracidiphilus sp.]|nr:SDR family oxidoreductase [Terracidiphilus sp.]